MVQVINHKINQALAKASHLPFVGFVSGPARAIAATAQITVNLVAIPILVVPSAAGVIKKDNPFHAKQCLRDAYVGLRHIIRAFAEVMPCTFCCLDSYLGENGPRQRGMRSDDPFKHNR